MWYVKTNFCMLYHNLYSRFILTMWYVKSSTLGLYADLYFGFILTMWYVKLHYLQVGGF